MTDPKTASVPSLLPAAAVEGVPVAWRLRFRTKWAEHGWSYTSGPECPPLERWDGHRGHDFEPLYAAPPADPVRAALTNKGDLQWLRALVKDQTEGGHIGEGTLERQMRAAHNDRVNRVLAALAASEEG